MFTSWEGQVTIRPVGDGESVMQVAVRHGVPGIIGECGGVLSCATCHVYVDDADLEKLPEMSAQEDEMLDGTASDRQASSRLSCQIELPRDFGRLHVTTPKFQD